MLKTVQITVPEQLLVRIDEAAARLKTNRSSLARQAFEETLFHLRLAQMEQQDAEAYARQPQDPAELADWESVQDWGDV
jgi:metal-responsive CopG/Arc/MetJ family transcriptional regulator